MKHYLDLLQNCSCGREHRVSIANIHIHENVRAKMLDLITNNCSETNVVVVCDKNTWEAAGKSITEMMKAHNIAAKRCLLNGSDYVTPDEKTIGKTLIGIPTDADLLIGVGSGTLNDITRFLAYRLELPYYTFATAPSMDGYASSVSPLSINHIKTTVSCKPAEEIFADPKLLGEAPEFLTSAGFGDLFGKHIASMDWMVSHTMEGEYFCGNISKLLLTLLGDIEKKIIEDEPFGVDSIDLLIRGLILSGLTIQLAGGSSRPVSGSDHHISHFFEMKHYFEEAPKYLHGHTVAFGMYLMSRMYRMVFAEGFEGLVKLHETYKNRRDIDLRKQRLERSFKVMAKEKIASRESNSADPEKIRYLWNTLESRWEELEAFYKNTVLSPTDIERFYGKVNLDYKPQDYGYSRELVEDALICAKEIRPRFTLLTLLDHLSLLDYFTEKVVDELF
jgi:glycerol-1-phosphate dehydrogenase [NAD(P)+]